MGWGFWLWLLLVVAQIFAGLGLYFIVGCITWSYSLLIDEMRKSTMTHRCLAEEFRAFIRWLNESGPGDGGGRSS